MSAEQELAFGRAKKLCAVCHLSEDVHSAKGRLTSTVAWILCEVCDDAFGIECAKSQDPNCNFDLDFTCKTCEADSELKEASHGKPAPRGFSSEWIQSVSTTLASAESGRLPARDRRESLKILQQPSRPLLHSQLKKSTSSLKLPIWSDSTDEERAHARHCLALALEEKNLGFHDDVLYLFPDCPEVLLKHFIHSSF
jgi:hypothetical protein